MPILTHGRKVGFVSKSTWQKECGGVKTSNMSIHSENEFLLPSYLHFYLIHLCNPKFKILSLIQVASLYRSRYDRVVVITSQFEKPPIVPKLAQKGFSQFNPETDNTFWNRTKKIGINFLSEEEFFSVFHSQVNKKETFFSHKEDKALVLFDAGAFGFSFLSMISKFIHQFVFLTTQDVIDLIESYQHLKNYVSYSKKAGYSFLIDTTSAKAFQLIQTDFSKLVKKYLSLPSHLYQIDTTTLSDELDLERNPFFIEPQEMTGENEALAEDEYSQIRLKILVNLMNG